MIRHFFLDKTNTLVKGSKMNTGLNPVMSLSYGKEISRGIIHFDEKQILALVDDKSISDLDKLYVNLKMTNAFSVDGLPYEKTIFHEANTLSQRAASFDIIAFKLPQDFDEGRGFDFAADFWVNNNRSFNTHGATWYFAQDGKVWDIDKDKIDLTNPNLNMNDGNIYILENNVRHKIQLEGGIYPMEFIEEQIEHFNAGEDSIIIARQHFDFGNENMNLCITNYIKDIINGEYNYGIGLMFAPSFEKMEMSLNQYVGFFTDHTNTFFHPYIELIYDEPIKDDRACFGLGRENRLYLYVNDDGVPTNLDNIPICNIEDKEYVVKQAQKGVYYALIKAEVGNMEEDTIYYDKWSNLALNGINIEPIEMEFAVAPKERYTQIGSNSVFKDMTVPSIYGINNDEKLHRGEEREVVVDFRKKYTTDKKELVDDSEYRLYVKDGNRELIVIDYTPIERAFLNNFFIIHTQDLIPNEYFIDVRVKHGREIRYYKEAIRFKVISDVTERYE